MSRYVGPARRNAAFGTAGRDMASLELTKLCHLGAMAGLPGELGEDDRGTYTAAGIEKP